MARLNLAQYSLIFWYAAPCSCGAMYMNLCKFWSTSASTNARASVYRKHSYQRSHLTKNHIK